LLALEIVSRGPGADGPAPVGQVATSLTAESGCRAALGATPATNKKPAQEAAVRVYLDNAGGTSISIDLSISTASTRAL